MGQSFSSPPSSSKLPTNTHTHTHTPVIAATWGFGRIAVDVAKEMLKETETQGREEKKNALDAVEAGINAVELDNKEQYYVGLGGYPNRDGKMELDAAIIDGKKCRYGAVCALQGVVKAVSVARRVMEKSVHNLLVGDGATLFAHAEGFPLQEALTPEIRDEWLKYKKEHEENTHTHTHTHIPSKKDDEEQHDTIGVLVRDCEGNLAAGTSTSGWRYKHPGRVGDSPLVGSGLYADNTVGAAVATGDGEEIMRVCLSFLVVEKMREGLTPTEACRVGIRRLKEVVALSREGEGEGEEGGGEGGEKNMHEKLTVAVLAMDKDGRIGAASTLGKDNIHRGRPAFPYVVWKGGEEEPWIEEADDTGTD